MLWLNRFDIWYSDRNAILRGYYFSLCHRGWFYGFAHKRKKDTKTLMTRGPYRPRKVNTPFYRTKEILLGHVDTGYDIVEHVTLRHQVRKVKALHYLIIGWCQFQDRVQEEGDFRFEFLSYFFARTSWISSTVCYYYIVLNFVAKCEVFEYF